MNEGGDDFAVTFEAQCDISYPLRSSPSSDSSPWRADLSEDWLVVCDVKLQAMAD